jgi:hypothetical protein
LQRDKDIGKVERTVGIREQGLTRTSNRKSGAITNDDVGIGRKTGANGVEITRR